MTKSPYIVLINEQYSNSKNNNNKNNNNKKSGNTKLKNKKSNNNDYLSPTSGYEPKYEPNKWNDNFNIKNSHNCYAYVLNRSSHKMKNKPQPGYFSNFPSLKQSDYNCQSFYIRLKKDIPSLYLVPFNQKCKKGFYKGFIAIDTKDEDQDYHFYRQDSNGFWSHKPGRQNVINYDADKKIISNPIKANRNYTNFNYSTPCFFFCINNKLSSIKSK